MEPSVIYEDKDFLALDKPSGMVIHPDEHHKEGTLIQKVAKKYPEIKNVGDDPERPGLVHRLDKDTSGILLVARNQKAFEYLKSLFQNKQIKKTYLVLVVGDVKKNSEVIDLPIGRSDKDMRRLSGKGRVGKEREAITKYKILKRFGDYTLLEASPLTGRTHQIRSHFSALGHPVVCDKLYSGKRMICPAGLARQFLHAHKLEFVSPSGTNMALESDLPDDLEKVLEELR